MSLVIKRRHMINSAAIAALAVAGAIPASSVAALTWDADGTPPVSGGIGVWDLSTTNKVWNDGVSDVAWTNGNDAVFPTNTSTVSLGANVAPGALTLSTNGTTTLDLNGFNLTASGATTGHNLNTITNLNSTTTSTISSTNYGSMTLAGNLNVIKNGAAVWNTTQTNTFTGKLRLQGGSTSELIVTADGSLGASSAIVSMETGKLTLSAPDANPITYTHAIDMVSSSTINVNDKIVTIDAPITGTGNISRQGSGTMILKGNNSGYSGAITFTSADGTLILANNNALGTNTTTLSIQAGGSTGMTLGFQGGVTVNTTKLIQTPQALGNSGKGIIHSFSGANTFTGSVELLNTTITFGAETDSSLKLTGKILGSSSRGFYKIGPGTIELASANSEYRGVTKVRNGTLAIGADAPLGDGTTSSGNYGALGNQAYNGGNVLVSLGDGANTATTDNLGMVITGAFEVERPIAVRNDNASGTTTVGGTNTSGTAVFTSAITLSRDVILSSKTGGQVDFRPDTSNPYAANAGNLAPGIISGAFNATIDGGGTVRLAAVNTFGGAGKNVTVQNGTTLLVANSSNLGNASNGLVLNNGKLKFEAVFDPSTARTMTVQSGGAVFDTNNLNVSFGNAIGSTTGAITKAGAGTLTLSGANAQSGITTVAVGTLKLASGSTLNSSSAIVVGDTVGHSSAILDVTASGLTIGASTAQSLLGYGTVSGNISIGANGTLKPGGSIGTLASGTATFSDGTYAAEINSNTVASDLIAITGDLNISGNSKLTVTDLGSTTYSSDTTLTLATYSGVWNNGTFTDGTNAYADGATLVIGSNSYTLDYDAAISGGHAVTLTSAVPEPASIGLLAMAGGLLMARRRRLVQA